ncbi:MAG: helix-turn-helix domain-containing protein, partial [Rikenellaceae bacterium]
MVEKQSVLHRYRVDGDSKRKISRDLHISRKTVDKVIREYESALESDDCEAEIERLLITPPQYDSRGRHSRVVTDEIKALIDRYLQENKAKRRNGLRKQCMLKCDIHEHLLDKGYKISYPSVCNYIRTLEKAEAERRHHPAFI